MTKDFLYREISCFYAVDDVLAAMRGQFVSIAGILASRVQLS
jgi:hypothetical protein